MSAGARMKRLTREVSDIHKESSKSGITVRSLSPDSYDHLVGSFPGPTGTPYEGGVFEVDIQPPPNYPFAPLKMKFITKVYHPNVSSSTGFICLDILKTSWSPVYTLRTCLVSLQSLLSTPEPNDPQDAEVAKHYLSSRTSFDSTAQYWTQVYAKPNTNSSAPSIPSNDPQTQATLAGLEWSDVRLFAQMGFEERDVIEVLQRLNYRSGNKENVGHEAVLEKLFV
ncbi:BQ5605_C018g08654 [Microbotryum silenes-dioicae]|uniref:Ubiquitin-conjugating enzyme E2 1 n=1 Tax=Microbotryum silenes-dioicae TaxID=796604 RepID=A0A2X0MRK0_9BASI|nr:BQ5605_C018g08654 [Microbotryum silenes-dioicae]